MINLSPRSFAASMVPTGIPRAKANRAPRPQQTAPVAAEPSTAVSRKDVTDRLGLTADATDAEVLAAFDAKTTAGVAHRAWGASDALPDTAAPSAQMTADELYAAAWGDDA